VALIRKTTTLDFDDVRNVYVQAFPENERDLVAKLAADLLCATTSPPTISFLAESEGKIVGHVAFSPVTLEENADTRAYILAPLAVLPDFQRRRIGSELVKAGLRSVQTAGADLLFVYGDPDYYGRFGFSSETAASYTPPYDLQYPFGWQAIDLHGEFSSKTPSRISCVDALCHRELW